MMPYNDIPFFERHCVLYFPNQNRYNLYCKLTMSPQKGNDKGHTGVSPGSLETEIDKGINTLTSCFVWRAWTKDLNLLVYWKTHTLFPVTCISVVQTWKRYCVQSPTTQHCLYVQLCLYLHLCKMLWLWCINFPGPLNNTNDTQNSVISAIITLDKLEIFVSREIT